jgi:FAD/FMN-containing dehydrogenase/Fe-S oxidoreductase
MLSPAALRSLEATLRSDADGDIDMDAGTRALYATDASNYRQVPLAVVRPRTVDGVIGAVRACRAHRAPILPRGGGTSLAGQCCNAAVVIDTSRYLTRVLAIDPVARTARVEPGLVLDDLQRAAAPHGLMFGPDPATHAWCTLGGMIGNNSCGVHSIVGGLTADNVVALDALTADGTRLRLEATSAENAAAIARAPGRRGQIHARLLDLRDRHAEEVRARYPAIPRRVSGYNLDALDHDQGVNTARAVVGSEGTCVTVLEATVRLIPAPRARALLVLGFPDIASAADQVMPLLETKPIGLEAVDEVIVRNLRAKAKLSREIALLPDGDAWMLVEFGGPTASDAVAAAAAARRRVGYGAHAPAARVYSDPQEMRSLWLVRESGLGATAFVPGEAATWEGWEDAAVAPERLGGYLREFQDLLGRYDYHGALYGHFGQGCVHTRIDFDLETTAGIARFRAFLDEAADLVVRYGGSLSGEHGDGQARAALLPKMFGPELVGAFREFKAIWDPEGLMNPGKLVDAYSPTEHLRRPGYQPAATTTFFPLRVEGGIEGAALRCVGVGKCRKSADGTMCPSYMVTRDERHSTRGRAHLLFEMLRGETLTDGWRSEVVKEALDLCLACKACKAECPVAVDMATYKAEFLAHYYEHRRRPLRAHLFGHLDRWAALASRLPRAVNALTAFRWLARPIAAAAGIAAERRLPRFAPETFQRWWQQRRSPRHDGPPVVLWPDTFTNYFHPAIARAAVAALEHVGYAVTVPPQTCCGRPLYDFGLLDAARRHLEAVFAVLAQPLRDRVPIVVLEPSCFATLRDEAVGLFPDHPAAHTLSEQATLLEAFLRPHFERGDLPPLGGDALVQLHCHQQALTGREAAAEAIAASGLHAQVLDAGCCGMAGAFGFDAAHYPVSVAVGERALLPAIRRAGATTTVVANGFSCREQIDQLAGRRPLHFAELVHGAIGGPS